MLKLNISNMLIAKGIMEPGAWLRKHGITHKSAYKLAGGTMDHIRMGHLGIISFDSWCTPNDMLQWTPGKGQDIPNHPLQALRANASLPRVLPEIMKMSAAQLRLLEELIIKMKEVK